MKSNYIVRASKFIRQFAPYLDKFNDVYTATVAFNKEHRRAVSVKRGAVRYALLTSDYVIKWNYDLENATTFGGCEQELAMWNEIRNTIYADLFAEITPVTVNDRTFYIMPRIDKLGCHLKDDDLYGWISEEALDFIYEHLLLHDLHNENWGLLNGSPVIIDYACAG